MSMPAQERPPNSRRMGDGLRVLDVYDVSAILDRDPHTVRRYFREGTIPGAKRLAGGRWIILQADLDDFLTNR
jgi:predicted site-specific integrase-resolvase